MPKFSPDELSAWVSRLWKNGVPESMITGVSHDTRTIRPGDLYVAIRGDRFDGHEFVCEAFEKGAVGALVEERFTWSANPVLRVPDTLRGLWLLAAGYRKTWSGTVVGITGSVGKTTVKEMVADLLSLKCKTHRTAGNYNNHIGLPLTMMAMERDAGFGVFEIGMNQPGEIGALADLLQPHIGIITDIGSAHMEHFQSVEEIACEKAGLIEKLPNSGIAVIDRDSEWFGLMEKRTCARIVTVSMGGEADYSGYPVDSCAFEVNGYCYEMPIPGEHVMRNALRAIAVGMESGLSPEEINAGLQLFNPPPMRWEQSEIRNVIFINDAYNANPLSMRAILRTFKNLDGKGRKWVVLGGMRELGSTTQKEHEALGRFVAGLAFDGVVAVGELGKSIVCEDEGAFFHAADVGEVADILNRHLEPHDMVLLKASRGERLERVLDCFGKP